MFSFWNFPRAGSLPPVLLFLLLGVFRLQAADPQMDFTRANQAFSSDHFSEAAAIYDSIIKNHGASPELYYNLGNALARRGEAGPSVLAYERGLLLNPRDPEIRANLEKVRQKNNLFEKTPSFWTQPFLMLSQNFWAGFLLFSFWVVALSALVRVLGRARFRKGLLDSLAGAGVLFTLLALAALAGTAVHAGREDRSVVVTPDLPLMISPFAGSAVSTALKSGEIIHAGESHGEYTYVKNDEGKNGWVRTRDIEKVQ